MSTTGLLLGRAAWAPLLVFGLHIIFEYGIRLYARFPLLDLPMHFFGGMAIAYFASSCFAALPESEISRKLRPVAQFIFSVTMTATAAILWEVLEYASDTLFHTGMFGSQYDTLMDLTLGLSGAAVLMSVAAASGRLGIVRPIR